jgi:phosphoglucomutase
MFKTYTTMQEIINANVAKWLNGNIDADTKKAIESMNEEERADAFYKNLEFGTGGLRGIMGAGTNRMNKYTVGMATQGFANYINKVVTGNKSVAVAYDVRNNSKFFAQTIANVFAANGIKVYLYSEQRPTPQLSFTIRQLGCTAGVVVTASHNPKEYNGYKAYWNDGAQVMPPHDKNIITEVNNINSFDEVKFTGGEALIEIINPSIDEDYQNMLVAQSINPDIINAQHDLKIVYTPIHGTGATAVPQTLAKFGFTNVTIVKEQEQADGNFSTVVYPNPEESEAMSIGLAKAKAIDADILLGTDPDSDRVGIAIKNHKGEWVLMNGNQTGVLLFNYIVEARKAKGIATPKDYLCKTIVTTELIDEFAKQNNVECLNTLTGFKYIAEIIGQRETTHNFICGGEESFGYMVGDKVRDKDAVASVCFICEMAAVAKAEGKTLFDKLIDIHIKYGFYKEHLISITKKGMRGAEEIADMMKTYRANPPKTIAGQEVVALYDYELSVSKDLVSGQTTPITLAKSNVLQFKLKDGSKISARPSGTEPKIKFYVSVKGAVNSKQEYTEAELALDEKIKAIIKDMNLS